MNMEVRHDVPEQQVIDMTRPEHALDRSPDILNVRPVLRKFVGREISERRDMAAPKHHGHMPDSDGAPLEKSLADSAAVE